VEGHINSQPHFNSVNGYISDPQLTDVLEELFTANRRLRERNQEELRGEQQSCFVRHTLGTGYCQISVKWSIDSMLEFPNK
jgi:hypothetical protein